MSPEIKDIAAKNDSYLSSENQTSRYAQGFRGNVGPAEHKQ